MKLSNDEKGYHIPTDDYPEDRGIGLRGTGYALGAAPVYKAPADDTPADETAIDEDVSGEGKRGIGERYFNRRPSPAVREKRIEELEKKLSEVEDRWKRAAAEIENSRKRLARDFELQRALDREAVFREWLPVVDNMERALDAGGKERNGFFGGVQAIYQQMLGVLKAFKVVPFNPKGEQFDPKRHEAVATVSPSDGGNGNRVDRTGTDGSIATRTRTDGIISDGAIADGTIVDGTIAGVVLKGYTIGDRDSSRVLRPAKVVTVAHRSTQ